jgi:uncharacterized membrane protein (DUF485 family)
MRGQETRRISREDEMVEHILAYPETRPIELAPSEALALLVRRKLRVIGVMTAIYMTSYIGLTLLAGFFRGAMTVHALGPINVGFVLIAANYLLSWILAIAYVRVAHRHFDPLAADIRTILQAGGRAS